MDHSHQSAASGGQVASSRSLAESASVNKSKQPRFRRKRLTLLIIGVVVFALLASAYYFHEQSRQSRINSSEYQAVFLTNGQVYFGKLQQDDGGYLRMSDIYYLQAQQAQPTGNAVTDATKNGQQNTDAANTQLVKLGQELHAPEDRMTINKDQVLFWENIKASGKVAQAISDYKAKK